MDWKPSAPPTAHCQPSAALAKFRPLATPKGNGLGVPETRVLVADDDFAVRESFRLALTAAGFTVRTAEDGQQALEVLRSGFLAHVIILDLMMPIVSGWEFLEEKARDETIKRIPVLLMTAFEHGNAPFGNVVATLRKPADMRKLVELIKSLGPTQ
jgi:two-component system, OmpR family, response regulator CpxR